MNAYGLADELERFESFNGDVFFGICAVTLRQQADRIAELEKDGKVCATCGGLVYDPVIKQTKPLSDEEIYALWCEADNTELLPEMRLKDGSINYIITTFAKLIEERHGIK